MCKLCKCFFNDLKRRRTPGDSLQSLFGSTQAVVGSDLESRTAYGQLVSIPSWVGRIKRTSPPKGIRIQRIPIQQYSKTLNEWTQTDTYIHKHIDIDIHNIYICVYIIYIQLHTYILLSNVYILWARTYGFSSCHDYKLRLQLANLRGQAWASCGGQLVRVGCSGFRV